MKIKINPKIVAFLVLVIAGGFLALWVYKTKYAGHNIPPPPASIDQLPRVEVDAKDVFKNPKSDWAPSEDPAFDITLPGATPPPKSAGFLKTVLGIKNAAAAESKIIKTEILAPGGLPTKEDIKTSIKDNGDGTAKITVIKPERYFREGEYVLQVEMLSADNQQILTTKQNFTWGVLAINVAKSIYTPGERANLMIGVLDEFGGMVCDAKLTLDIKDPSGATKTLSTDSGEIKVNDICNSHDFSLAPDYSGTYQTGGTGTYQMTLTAETQNGTYSISDKFEVRNAVAFDVERVTATRTYPKNTYPMMFNITAN